MIFNAVVSNKSYPEYGVATIPFPIPSDQYNHTIELLEPMDIGAATAQDCRAEELTSKYPILNRLVTQNVNVDELDYLAKRLESFCTDESAQFQAMAFRFCLSDIKDFINLTFCCIDKKRRQKSRTSVRDFCIQKRTSAEIRGTHYGILFTKRRLRWVRAAPW